MRIVVDASVFVAALMANGTVRDVLLTPTEHDLFAPTYIRGEIVRNRARIATRSGVPLPTINAITEELLQSVELVPETAYAQLKASAQALAAKARAWGDEEYIALALFLDAPIWALDDAFRRVGGISVLTTREMLELGP